jgi:hypothetical protein
MPPAEELAAELRADRIKAAYGPNYPRLVTLKNMYDPTNPFPRNQNIKPNRREELASQRHH